MDDDIAASFRTSPEGYDSHIGRYGTELARGLIDLAGVAKGDRVLDVGCGTGKLTVELAAVVGADSVAAVDPSEPFARATQQRVPGADVQVAPAEALPFASATFHAAFAQLVVNFMSDAASGVNEMRRVVRPDGRIAACVWDYAGEMTLLRTFWDAAREIDPASAARHEGSIMRYCDPDSLTRLWSGAGLRDVAVTALWPTVHYLDFDTLWHPFLAGVAPSGAYTVSLDDARRADLRDEFFRRLGRPAGEFTLTARAWAIVGRR